MSRFASYTIGFVTCIVLSSVAFLLGFIHIGAIQGMSIRSAVIVPIVMVLAFIQLAVQLYFFLHLGPQEEARWNTVMFGITLGTIMLVLVAITWIMNNLNDRMMSPSMQSQYISDQSSF